jgi:hypothetical protein
MPSSTPTRGANMGHGDTVGSGPTGGAGPRILRRRTLCPIEPPHWLRP